MEKRKNSILLIVISVILVMSLLFGGSLFLLSSMGYIEFKGNSSSEVVEEHDVKDEKLTIDEAISVGEKLYDKSRVAYEVWAQRPYCGLSFEEIYSRGTVKYTLNNGAEIDYYDSGYKNLEELKEDLSQWLSETIINEKINEEPVTDLSKLGVGNTGDDYIIDDGKLYCREYTGKGWYPTFLDEYSLTVVSISENRIIFKAFEKHIKDYWSVGFWSGNYKEELDDEDIIYLDNDFELEKVDDRWVVSKFSFINNI